MYDGYLETYETVRVRKTTFAAGLIFSLNLMIPEAVTMNITRQRLRHNVELKYKIATKLHH